MFMGRVNTTKMFILLQIALCIQCNDNLKYLQGIFFFLIQFCFVLLTCQSNSKIYLEKERAKNKHGIPTEKDRGWRPAPEGARVILHVSKGKCGTAAKMNKRINKKNEAEEPNHTQGKSELFKEQSRDFLTSDCAASCLRERSLTRGK